MDEHEKEKQTMKVTTEKTYRTSFNDVVTFKTETYIDLFGAEKSYTNYELTINDVTETENYPQVLEVIVFEDIMDSIVTTLVKQGYKKSDSWLNELDNTITRYTTWLENEQKRTVEIK